MSLNHIAKRVGRTLRSNSPTILTGAGVTGVLTTSYLVGKASYAVGESEYSCGRDMKYLIKNHWKEFIPAAASGALTIACIIGGTRIGAKRAATAYSLLAISEKAMVEYKDKVVEVIGEKKEKAIRDEIAQDQVTKTAGSSAIIVAEGDVLCFEQHTGRYFKCDMETLRRAENDINAQLHSENEANLNDFYHLVGLDHTSYSSCTGWTSDKNLKLSYTAVLTDKGKPCISFEYNYVTQL